MSSSAHIIPARAKEHSTARLEDQVNASLPGSLQDGHFALGQNAPQGNTGFSSLEPVEDISAYFHCWSLIGAEAVALARTGYASGKRQLREKHDAIIAALADRDPAAARAAMIAHIDAFQRCLFKGEE